LCKHVELGRRCIANHLDARRPPQVLRERKPLAAATNEVDDRRAPPHWRSAGEVDDRVIGETGAERVPRALVERPVES
jgi:hypothetical protein